MTYFDSLIIQTQLSSPQTGQSIFKETKLKGWVFSARYKYKLYMQIGVKYIEIGDFQTISRVATLPIPYLNINAYNL